MINILLIGLGYHAKRIYYPICMRDGEKYNFKLAHCVDLVKKKNDIDKYLQVNHFPKIEIRYITDKERTYGYLHPKLEKDLNDIVREKKIKGVLISTEPMVHIQYAKWALKNNLHILMDKPVSTAKNINSSLKAIETIKNDYNELVKYYKKSNATFSLMAQRRHHPAFLKIRELLKEVFVKTNCPITSIQSFHGDGQWRMPTEIIEQDYHPYNQGYGKCSHSGYHSIDIVPWLIRSVENDEKYFDNVDVCSNFVNPIDFINQLKINDYRKLFKNFDKHNKYSEKYFIKKCKNFGEIDAFNLLSFKQANKIMTLASINLAHNGCAQRNWVTTIGKDLYKGNGRIRHESHYIEQGPFQSISYVSYQSREINLKDNLKNIYGTGGEYHLDLHIFRNSKMFKSWKPYEKISIKDLNINIMEGKSRGHQEDSRRKAVLEFISIIQGDAKNGTSDLLDHRDGTMLLYGIYKSALLKKMGKNSSINIKLKK